MSDGIYINIDIIYLNIEIRSTNLICYKSERGDNFCSWYFYYFRFVYVSDLLEPNDDGKESQVREDKGELNFIM